MTDRAPIPASRPAAKKASLGQSLLTVAAAATTCAAVIWSVLFYNATNRHADAVAAPAAPAQVTAGGSAQPATTPAPVTTRTS